MSASLAGKFQDHYSILGVEPKASLESLQSAHAKLVEKYGADNFDTADPEKLEAVNLALEVLSDPDLRREFDKLKGIDQDPGVRFSGPEFFSKLARGSDLRIAIVCILYDRRRSRPFSPSVSVRQLESMLETGMEELNFALWYLKQRNFVTMDDKSSLQITVDGMDFLETKQPTAEVVMPLLKAGAAATAIVPSKEPVPAGSAVGSVRNALLKAGRRH